MKTEDALKRIEVLEYSLQEYRNMIKYSNSFNFNDKSLIELITKTKKEIEVLKELIFNMELDDSYDQNTGKLHLVYKQ